jgi:hypothetical protein
MKVLLFGGTGFVGRNLIRELTAHGYQIIVVTRNAQKMLKLLGKNVHVVEWDNIAPLGPVLTALGDAEAIKEIDVIVNLAGESIGSHRWTSAVKVEILESRVRTTHAVVSAINEGIIKPQVLVNASAVGYYGPCQDEEITETERAGQDFLAQVCQEWENEAYQVDNGLTRVVTLRLGIVIGPEGALNRMALPFEFYLGGPMGTGKQWLPWIHVQDLARLIRFVIEHRELVGPVNAVAPQTVRMKEFSKTLGEVLTRPSWLPVPEFLLRIVLGQMAEMLIYGQRAIPRKILDAGFEYEYPHLKSALENRG